MKSNEHKYHVSYFHQNMYFHKTVIRANVDKYAYLFWANN